MNILETNDSFLINIFIFKLNLYIHKTNQIYPNFFEIRNKVLHSL